ncbi:unnamed protein product, partial [Didymodactylos carnosus]
NEEKVYWKCEFQKTFSCHARLHTDLNNVIIKVVGEGENHAGNPRSESVKKFHENLKQETAHNHTNPHNILTQNYIGVPDEANDFKHRYETDVEFADNIHKIASLSFLEPTSVAEGFELLCSKFGDDYEPILDYIEDTYIDKLIKEENNLHSDIVNAKSVREPAIQKQYESLNKRLHSLVENPHPTIYDQLQAIGCLLNMDDKYIKLTDYLITTYISGEKFNIQFWNLYDAIGVRPRTNNYLEGWYRDQNSLETRVDGYDNIVHEEENVRLYLYQMDPSKTLQCDSNPLLSETHLPGGDFLSLIPSSADPFHCNTLCCTYMSCVPWSYASSAPSDFNDCHKNEPCCYLKSYITESSHNPTIISAIMNRTFPYNHPPSGLRLAVPLGDITTDSIELRGDGIFHDWTIENQSPATGAKFNFVDDALLAFRIKNSNTNESDARLIRTHSNHDIKDIQYIKYYGSYPVSKLELINDTILANIDLYAYSIFKPGNLNRSMIPAIIYSLNIYNPNSYPVNIDFMYSLPLSCQIDQTRQSNNIIQQILSDKYIDCINFCDQ